MKPQMIALVLGLVSLASFAQELPLKKEPIFKEGEVLQYKLKYGFITAADTEADIADTVAAAAEVFKVL